ncbi:MAG TPA: M20/M25/M40 family metallo-hydrolase [Kiritimatiellia bacterium]|nr:M20/M25/M40 family metallo-hydrolase [Kiritimatiellia bacterium]HRZ13529.1 M20/M25/M40 family metallo-hydrolase [Kiritimatiellia bacterium]HSA19166.1 M20/M25/M40 family metallo-hydrolase [Kiritimatiellia bacterium]
MVLARIPIAGRPADLPLPVCAHLQDAAGGEYVLTRATESELEAAGRPHEVLDPAADGARYLLAYPRRPGAREAAAARFRILLDDGRRLLIRGATDADALALAEGGCEVRWLGDRPLAFVAPRTARRLPDAPTALTASAHVRDMLARVTTNGLAYAMNELTGPAACVADGSYTNIRTRYTTSGRPSWRANAYMAEYFSALGLSVTQRAWAVGGTSNRNVIATLPGTTASSEVVVICAHIDNMPSGATAPGADDNASGSLAVLLAAEVFRDFTFQRTIRFVLFTGEEQGLYGSEAYAAQCAAAGDNIVGVLNLDMIAWDSGSDGVLWLDTRLTSDPGYAADRAIAAMFTNVVAVYGISGLAAQIHANGVEYSDHYSFWTEGYPAILAIEDDDDFNPYYHTTSDTASTLNWTYFARFVQASIATVAHLVVPVDRAPFDAVRVISGPFAPTSTVGHGTFVARHQAGAAEGDDRCDAGWSNAPVFPLTNRLALMSRPGGTNLYMDARPQGSETIFFANLVSIQTNASLATTNRLRFDWVGGADTNAAYLVRVVVTGQYVAGGSTWTCVTNLRELMAAGGFLSVPASLQVTNRAVYGSCEIRRLGVDREAVLAWAAAVPTNPVLRVEGPPGIQVADLLEWSGTLTNWTAMAVVTSRVAATAATFASGENPLYPSTPAPPADGQPRFYRLRRRWILP